MVYAYRRIYTTTEYEYMIKLLTLNDIDDIKNLLNTINTVTGESMDSIDPITQKTRKNSIIDFIVTSCLAWNSPFKRTIGWYHNGELKAVMIQDFSMTVKAWLIVIYFSSCGSLLGRIAGGECLDFAIEEAERLNYYEYYRVVESSKYKAFNKFAISKLRHRYELVADELVPCYEKPMTTLAWEWLFRGQSKTVDVVIVKGVLKQEFRPNII